VPANTVEYNYFTFEEIGGLWHTTIERGGQPYIAAFRFNPEQTEEVYVTGNLSRFNTQPVYITFDPQSDDDQFKYLALATAELGLNLVRGLNMSIEAACTTNGTAECLNRSIVTCDSNLSVVYLKSESPTQITYDDNCVIVSGHEFDLLKSVDRFLFQWYRIMR